MQIFVSHSERDSEYLPKIVEIIENAGVKAYVAERDLKPTDLDSKIKDGIAKSDYVLVLWTENSEKSARVVSEIEIAYEKRKRILPFVKKGVERYHLLYPTVCSYFDKLGDLTRMLSDIIDILTTEKKVFHEKVPGVTITSKIQKQMQMKYYVFEAKGLAPDNTDGTYLLIIWRGQTYIGIKGKSKKLVKFLLETEPEEKQNLEVGETWDLGNGYKLTAQAIDAKATPRQAWLVFSKDGTKLDDKVVAQGEIYTVNRDFLAEERNVPFFVTYIDYIFAGANSDIIQFKYTWLTSPDMVYLLPKLN